MLDRYNRNITYLRISITDRCNLRCSYCMPAEGVLFKPHEEIITFEEIVEVVKVAVGLGITKFRLTGGEPLVRSSVVDLVRMIKSIEGVLELTLTTNGILLPKFAIPLKEAGLDRVNISIDSMNSNRYREITRGGELKEVLAGVDAALEAGLTPIKINCVVNDTFPQSDADDVKRYAEEKGIKARFIKEMELSKGTFSKVEGGDGGDCSICNRIRLTADGYLRPCLFSNKGFSIREYEIKEAFALALHSKPKEGKKNSSRGFWQIGG
ncbi:MAG: radical SAM protein [Breznakibacter sp.]|nr:radical SAM protein [Breznakibacter sp.]